MTELTELMTDTPDFYALVSIPSLFHEIACYLKV